MSPTTALACVLAGLALVALIVHDADPTPKRLRIRHASRLRTWWWRRNRR